MTIEINNTITATRVSDEARMQFLPRYFGEEFMLRGESTVFRFMRQLSPSYNGGFWNFYDLSNGGFYMSLDSDDPMLVEVDGNGFSDEMSADAASIVANLFALGELTALFHEGRFVDHYYALREFAREHPESTKIFRAID